MVKKVIDDYNEVIKPDSKEDVLPTNSVAFSRGMLAGVNKRLPSKNPYEVGTTDFLDWERGYHYDN